MSDQKKTPKVAFDPDPNAHIIKLKSTKEGDKDYLPVQWRLVWFRRDCEENSTISTELIHLDLDRDVEAEAYAWNNEKRKSEKVIKRAKGIAIFKAIITDGKGNTATGTKSQNAAEFDDFIEKAETGSIGRALAALGFGTQFAPEYNEGPPENIVDAGVTSSQESHERREEPPTEGAPSLLDKLKNQYDSYYKDSAFGIKLMKQFGDRVLKVPLAEAPEKSIRAALELLAIADLLTEIAKAKDPEFKALGRLAAEKGAKVDHPIDIMGSPAQRELILGYYRELKNLAGSIPSTVMEKHGELLKQLNKAAA